MEKCLSFTSTYNWGHLGDDPKLPGDNGEVIIPDWSVGGSIPAVKYSLNLTEKNKLGR